MTAPRACPECGGDLLILEACAIEEVHAPGYLLRRNGTEIELPRWNRTAPAAACNACDFVIEISATRKKESK